MIYGIGTDLCSIERIEKALNTHGERFTARILTKNELTTWHSLPNAQQASFLAKRFAAKEACAKALGTGIRGEVSFHAMEVSTKEHGRPEITLSSGAAALLPSAARVHVSLSDDYPFAMAYVVIEIMEKK